MKQLVILVEEPSMQALLEKLLPRILPGEQDFLVVAHEGKTDLRESIPRKLRAWKPLPHFVILHDQDNAECHALKSELITLCEKAGRPDALVRIVCHDLESWILGDMQALAEAFDKPSLAGLRRKSTYRNPDNLSGAAQQLRKLIPGYRKVSGAERVGAKMVVERNTSRSFRVFLAGLQQLVESG